MNSSSSEPSRFDRSAIADDEATIPFADWKKPDPKLAEVERLRAALAEQRRLNQDLKVRLEFENLLSSFSTALMNAGDDEIVEPLRGALLQIMKFAAVERLELFKQTEDGAFTRLMMLGASLEPTEADSTLRFGDQKSASLWFWTQMAAGRSIRARSRDDLPSSAQAERERMRLRGAESIFIAPLSVGQELVGILALETVQKCHLWPSTIVRQVELLGGVIAGALHRHRIHRRLFESEAQFRSVVQGQEEFILRWSPNGQIVFANSPWRRYMGLGSDDSIGAGFWDCIAEKDRRPVEEAISSLDYWKTAAEEEHAVTRPDGTQGWHHWMHRVVHSSDGERVAFQSVGRDVTRRKQAEVALEEQRWMLAHATRIATMSEMVGGLSHEVNQPLYAIKNFGSAILKMLDREPVDLVLVREWAEMISTSAERAGEIIRRLREFLSGKQVDWQSERVADLIEGAIGMVDFELSKRRVRIHKLIEPPDASIEADRVQLQQVLINLLRNSIEALQAQEHHDREISICARALGGRVVLEVSDNGPGIAPKMERNLFQAFQTTKAEGMGLGLTISRTIVQAHGGTIEFRPREGGGASFLIVLPPRGGVGTKREERRARDSGPLDVN